MKEREREGDKEKEKTWSTNDITQSAAFSLSQTLPPEKYPS